jgi:hypothetical protein
MADAFDITKMFRCPMCLFQMRADEDYAADTVLECVKCERTFSYKDALKNRTEPITIETAVPPKPESWTGTVVLLASWAGFTLMACIWTWQLGRDVKGPEFLPGYAAFAIIVTFSQWFLRKVWNDTNVISALAAVLIVSVAAARIISGQQIGMRTFEGLYAIMFIGMVVQFIRAEHLNTKAGRGLGGCGGGCGSSCGGGCGGGCGGCGG